MRAPAFIPSPEQGVWYLGPLPLRAYALLIILGIVVAVWLGTRRYVARGGRSTAIMDIAIWAVPFGIIGGRIYHVLTDPEIYFGPGGRGLLATLRIWDGGLGIWGAVVLGGVGAWIATRRMGLPLPPVADAIAPGIALAQAIGRWGNYFNQELFGAPTTVPWALEISPEHRPAGYGAYATFHPTFLYESLWLVGVAVVVIWADRRFRMGHGRAFALYVLLYCLGRVWIESLRIDDANHILGLRLNVWTSLLVALGALVYLLVSRRLRPGRETPAEVDPPGHSASIAATAAGSDAAESGADSDTEAGESPDDEPDVAGGDAAGAATAPADRDPA